LSSNSKTTREFWKNEGTRLLKNNKLIGTNRVIKEEMAKEKNNNIFNGNRKFGKVIYVETDDVVPIKAEGRKKETEDEEQQVKNAILNCLEIPVFGFLSEVKQV
jgi:hypothetical protein